MLMVLMVYANGLAGYVSGVIKYYQEQWVRYIRVLNIHYLIIHVYLMSIGLFGYSIYGH